MAVALRLAARTARGGRAALAVARVIGTGAAGLDYIFSHDARMRNRELRVAS
jgi:hypothetical protein